MTHCHKKLTVLFTGLAVWLGVETASAVTAENPYQAIVDRNVFGLKPPPPPPTGEEVKPPPPNIVLTGITTIFGNKRALMRTPPGPAKPGEQPREQSYMLAEGQKDGEIEVVRIDEKAGIVKIAYSGTPVELSFDKNAPKTGGGAPAMPGNPAIPAPAGMAPAHFTAPNADGGMKALPTRTLRLPGQTGAVPMPSQPAAGAAYSSGAANYNYGNAGAFNSGGASVNVAGAQGTVALPALGTSPTTRIQPNWPPESPMTHDEQVAINMLQRTADPGIPSIPGASLPEQNAQPQQPVPNNNNFQQNPWQQQPLPGRPVPPPGF